MSARSVVANEWWRTALLAEGTMQVLLVGTEPSVAVNALRVAGYSVYRAHEKCEAELALESDSYDLVLLDLITSNRDASLTEYRNDNGTALVLAKSGRETVTDQEVGLDAGAGDSLTKSIDRAELGALVRKLSRGCASASEPVYRHGNFRLDSTRRTAFKGDTPLALLPREFELLQVLIHEPLRVFARAELAESVFGKGEKIESNAIDVLVHRLRRKIGADVVLTLRGRGYRLAACRSETTAEIEVG
jgi:two-component system, OmpR family, response regulator QseB